MNDNSLDGLKDIHFPDITASWFPPALGWWLLLAIIICLWLGIKLWHILRIKSLKYISLRELNNIEKNISPKAPLELSIILKRICLVKFKEDNIRDIYGKEWADYINNKGKDFIKNKQIAEDIALAPYKNNSSFSDDKIASMVDFCKDWVRRVI